jgi:hypothetical protein
MNLERLERFIAALWPNWALRRMRGRAQRRKLQQPERVIPEHPDMAGERWLPKPEQQETERI